MIIANPKPNRPVSSDKKPEDTLPHQILNELRAIRVLLEKQK